MVVKSDITPPTVTISATDGTRAIPHSGFAELGASITFSFVLSEAAVGDAFLVADITKSGCSGSTIAGSGVTWKIVCARSSGADISVQVPANKFTDQAGAGNAASNLFVVLSDNTLPTVTITAGDSTGQIAHNGFSTESAVTWTFALSEPARKVLHSGGVAAANTDLFALADVTKSNCNNPKFSGTELLYYLRCDGDGAAAAGTAISVAVGAGSGTGGFKDAAGNLNAAGAAYVVKSDITPPTVTISASDSGASRLSGAASIIAGSTGERLVRARSVAWGVAMYMIHPNLSLPSPSRIHG
jgi:hypothetical protein